MTVVIIEDAGGTRRASDDEFPLALGGRNAAVRLPELADGKTPAWLGQSGGDLFLQAGEAGIPVTCNGMPVSASQWVRPGDVVRIGEARLTLEDHAEGVRVRVDRIETREDSGDPVVMVATPVSGGETAIRPVEFRPRDAAPAPRARPRLPVWPVAGLLVLGVVAIVGWFVLSTPRVVVQVNPEPDSLAIEGGPGLEIAGRRLLRPGRYVVIAEKEGFRRLEAPVQVTREREQIFAFALEPLPGLLQVDAGGVEGAEVLVDGTPAGGTAEPIELEAGEHAITVRADRHREFTTTVRMEGRGVSQTLATELVPLWSEVRFESSPSGATVRVDGEPVGTTPLTSELMPGRHRLEFRLDGHKTVRDSIRVDANEPQTWPRVNLVLQDGKLVLRSEPAGATVTVDGSYRGEAPMDVYLKPGRDHEVVVTKAGHLPASRRLTLGAGETAEWTARLAPRQGEVEIVVRPAGGEILVNGTPRGGAGGTLRLPAVPHDIEIRMEGFVPYRTKVTPQPGFPQTIRVELEPLVRDVAATAPRTIESPDGQTLVLVDGGRFRMGASRREPGRRANETLRDVELTRPFYVATKEVTNRQFGAFREGHLSGQVGGHNLEVGHHPVVQVTWEEAALYCNWLSERASLTPAYQEVGGVLVAAKPLTAGYRLPLEAEWAWAARYHDDAGPRKYPWGDSLPVAPGSGNYADASAAEILSQVIADYDDTFPVTAPAGSFPPNALGLHDIGGNVAEWVHDIYTIYASTSGTLSVDPTGGTEGELHTIRGSSWMHSTVSQLRLTYRDYGKKARPDVGFRIARYAE